MQMQVHIGLLYYLKNKTDYFDSFGVEYIPNKIKEFIVEFPEKFPGNKNIKTIFFEYKKIIQ